MLHVPISGSILESVIGTENVGQLEKCWTVLKKLGTLAYLHINISISNLSK